MKYKWKINNEKWNENEMKNKNEKWNNNKMNNKIK